MDNTVYIPPSSDLKKMVPVSKASKWTTRIGIFLFAGPVWGLLGTIFGMMNAFSALSKNDSTAPEGLSEAIGFSLYSSLIGGSLGFLGMVVILFSLHKLKNRELWFYQWATALAILWSILLFPIGILVGAVIFFSFRAKHSEFYSLR